MSAALSKSETTDDELMIVSAVRYCIGRRTYMVGICASWLIRHWPELGERARMLIQRDLDEAFERDDNTRALGASHDGAGIWHPLGFDYDRAQWEKVQALWREVKP